LNFFPQDLHLNTRRLVRLKPTFQESALQAGYLGFIHITSFGFFSPHPPQPAKLEWKDHLKAFTEPNKKIKKKKKVIDLGRH